MRALTSPRRILPITLPLMLLAIAFVLTPASVSAKPENVTDAELKMLPSYCPDTMWFPDRYKTSASRWVSVMGQNFSAMHHYCWALITTSRAQRAGVPTDTRFSMRMDAVNDYLYVINKSPSDFILLPEIYTKLGETELLLKQPNKANAAFSNARKLKPDYWPAYSQWVEYLIKTGKRSEALELVTLGLKHAPNAKVLREQYRLLGGKAAALPVSAPQTNEEKKPDTD